MISSYARGRSAGKTRRRGLATLWLILTLPVIVVALCLIVEVANLWIARAELEDALEAAALAAVKDWGDMNGGDTNTARQIGNDFAKANAVRGMSVDLDVIAQSFDGADTDLNYDNSDPINNPNQNAKSADFDPPTTTISDASVLIFGAITQTQPSVIFDAGATPSCGGATVMFDVTNIGNPGNRDNSWRISFYDTPNTPAVTITQIVINLQANGGTGLFTNGPAVFSANLTPAVKDTNNISQNDNLGLVASDVTFTGGGGGTTTLTIDFAPVTFAPGDHFRFGGIDITGDGDNVGEDQVGITVTFSDTSTLTGKYIDTGFKQTDCTPDFDGDNLPPIITHPTHLQDLPCPESSAKANDGQSYVVLSSSGGGASVQPFAVRAQASMQVNSVCANILGLNLTTFTVSAKATAMFDCDTERPRLIRVDQFIP